MPSNNDSFICPECDSLVKGDVCLNCGHVLDVKGDDLGGKDESKDENKKEELSETAELKSAFSDYGNETDGKNEEKTRSKVLKIVFPVLLGVLLLILSGVSFYRFIYFTPDFISPLVLSAQDIKQIELTSNGEENVPITVLSDDAEKVIEFDPDLKKGNLKVRDYAKFANRDISLGIVAFDFSHLISKFYNDEIIGYLQEQLDITDDDLAVYFSDSFSYMLPDQNFETWGIVIGVEDNEYVEEKIDALKTLQETEEYKEKEYPILFLDVVELKEIPDGDIHLDSEELLGFKVEDTKIPEDEEEGSDSDKDSNEEDQDESEDTDEETEDENLEDEDITGDIVGEGGSGSVQGLHDTNVSSHYLIVSNTKEFMDQMRESSEGFLPNLSVDIQYVRTRDKILTVADAFIYRNLDDDFWGGFAERIATKYDYEGLDRILKDLDSSGLIVYTKDGKLRIISTDTN